MNEHVHLWRAVLLSGLADVAKGRDQRWLRSRDFDQVCAMAMVEPDAVRAAFRPEKFRRRPVIKHEAA